MKKMGELSKQPHGKMIKKYQKNFHYQTSEDYLVQKELKITSTIGHEKHK